MKTLNQFIALVGLAELVNFVISPNVPWGQTIQVFGSYILTSLLGSVVLVGVPFGMYKLVRNSHKRKLNIKV